MTNPQIIAALSQLAEAIRALTERQIIGEASQREALKELAEIRGRLDKLALEIDPVAGHYRHQEAVVKARAQIHQEEQARRGAWADLFADLFAPVRAVFAHPFAATVAVGLLIALAGWLGIKLPGTADGVPSVILENAGSTLTRARIGPRGQG